MPPKANVEASETFSNLKFFVPISFNHPEYPLRSALTERIKRHKGTLVKEAEIATADIIIYPFNAATSPVSKKLFQTAKQQNPPIRVLSVEWIDQTLTSGQYADFDQFDAQVLLDRKQQEEDSDGDADGPNNLGNQTRQRMERVPYTKKDIETIIKHLACTPHPPTGMNSARDLENINFRHSAVSYQTFLRDNYSKGQCLEVRAKQYREENPEFCRKRREMTERGYEQKQLEGRKHSHEEEDKIRKIKGSVANNDHDEGESNDIRRNKGGQDSDDEELETDDEEEKEEKKEKKASKGGYHPPYTEKEIQLLAKILKDQPCRPAKSLAVARQIKYAKSRADRFPGRTLDSIKTKVDNEFDTPKFQALMKKFRKEKRAREEERRRLEEEDGDLEEEQEEEQKQELQDNVTRIERDVEGRRLNEVGSQSQSQSRSQSQSQGQSQEERNEVLEPIDAGDDGVDFGMEELPPKPSQNKKRFESVADSQLGEKKKSQKPKATSRGFHEDDYDSSENEEIEDDKGEGRGDGEEIRSEDEDEEEDEDLLGESQISPDQTKLFISEAVKYLLTLTDEGLKRNGVDEENSESSNLNLDDNFWENLSELTPGVSVDSWKEEFSALKENFSNVILATFFRTKSIPFTQTQNPQEDEENEEDEEDEEQAERQKQQEEQQEEQQQEQEDQEDQEEQKEPDEQEEQGNVLVQKVVPEEDAADEEVEEDVKENLKSQRTEEEEVAMAVDPDDAQEKEATYKFPREPAFLRRLNERTSTSTSSSSSNKVFVDASAGSSQPEATQLRRAEELRRSASLGQGQGQTSSSSAVVSRRRSELIEPIKPKTPKKVSKGRSTISGYKVGSELELKRKRGRTSGIDPGRPVIKRHEEAQFVDFSIDYGSGSSESDQGQGDSEDPDEVEVEDEIEGQEAEAEEEEEEEYSDEAMSQMRKNLLRPERNVAAKTNTPFRKTVSSSSGSASKSALSRRIAIENAASSGKIKHDTTTIKDVLAEPTSVQGSPSILQGRKSKIPSSALQVPSISFSGDGSARQTSRSVSAVTTGSNKRPSSEAALIAQSYGINQSTVLSAIEEKGGISKAENYLERLMSSTLKTWDCSREEVVQLNRRNDGNWTKTVNQLKERFNKKKEEEKRAAIRAGKRRKID